MTSARMTRRAAVAAALTLAIGGPAAGASLEPVVWTELSFKARKLLMSASTTVSVQHQDRSTARGALRQPPGAAADAVPARVTRITTASDLPLGRDEVATAWLDADSGATLQAEKLVGGSDPYWKLRRYTPGGLFAWRAEPGSKGESGSPHTAWSNCDEGFEAWPSKIPPGLVVTDSYALLYLISAARLDRQDGSLRVLVYSDDRLVEVTFTSGRVAMLDTSYQERWAEGQRVRQGPVPVRMVSTSARPLDARPGEAPVDLDFMGIKGELTIAVELDTGVPVELEGRADVVGMIRVKLQEAVLKAPRTAQRAR